MEDEIKVGEFVRSWNGSIGKVTRIEEGRFLYDNKELICFIGSVVKHSFDIIDLIRVGDYVNGMLVVSVIELDAESNYIPTKIVFVNRDEKCTLLPIKIYNKDIKSILTKEMFEANVYKLEE